MYLNAHLNIDNNQSIYVLFGRFIWLNDIDDHDGTTSRTLQFIYILCSDGMKTNDVERKKGHSITYTEFQSSFSIPIIYLVKFRFSHFPSCGGCNGAALKYKKN